MLVRSVLAAENRIKEIINLMKHDLDIITSEGAIIQTNQFLMSKSSPFLKNLFTETVQMSSPAILHLPEISAMALRHLINILKKGFTTGRGSGDSVVKEIKIAAKVLGFDKFPALAFLVGRNPPEDIFSENVQQYLQREVEAGRIEDGDVEVLVDLLEEDDGNLNKHPQELEEREPSGLNGAGQPLVSIIQNILQDIESETNEETSQEPRAKELKKASSSKEPPKIIYSTGNNRNKTGKQMIRVRPIETLLSDREIDLSIINKNHGMDMNSNIEAPKASNKRITSSIDSQWIRMVNQSKKKCRVEIVDQTNHWSQEVTEITPNVLKVEGDDHGNQTIIHCGVCRKAFTNAGSLLSHSLKHDEYIGERNCTMCHFKGTRTTLLTHTRSKHTGEKLFHCSMCPKTFSSCTLKKSHEKAEKLKKKFWH